MPPTGSAQDMQALSDDCETLNTMFDHFVMKSTSFASTSTSPGRRPCDEASLLEIAVRAEFSKDYSRLTFCQAMHLRTRAIGQG
jgi:hypothetical protein